MVEKSQHLIDIIISYEHLIQESFANYQNAHFPARNPEFFCLELCGEAGELANLEKKLWKGKDIPMQAVKEEIADVFICIHNYANARGINLADAVSEKLKKIEEKRSYHEQLGTIY